MSNTRYLELNSSYRDRNLWPNPAEFEVSLAESGQRNKNTARDPVADSMPITSWISGTLDYSGATTGNTLVLDTVVGTSDLGNATGGNLYVLGSTDVLYQIDDYYVGLSIIDSGGIAYKVTSYRYLGEEGGYSIGEFILDGKFSTAAPYDLVSANDITSTPAQIFVPAGRLGSNSYNGMILYNETLGVGVPIDGYDEYNHLIQVDISAYGTWAAISALSIRRSTPAFRGVTARHSTSVFSLSTSVSTEDGTYTGDFLHVVDADATPTIPAVAPVGEARRIQKYVGLSTTFASPSPLVSNTFTLTAGSSTNDYYVGCYLLTPLNLVGTNYRVVTYNGSTRTGTINGVFSGEVAGSTVQIRTAFVSPAFSVIPTLEIDVEVLLFTRDNYNGLTYTGSMVSQEQMVCYEIELVNLILPNRTLNTGYGSRIAFYPYIYVEFTNVSSANSGTVNVIYSNDPNAKRMLFRVPVDDIPSPLISTFIKLDSDGSVQTVKFKPNDTLRFSVRLADGTLYKTLLGDDFSPDPPNQLVQISALFSMKRLQ